MYALINYCGAQVGQRPRTALAYVYLKNDRWYADVLNSDGLSKYKRPRSIRESEVLHDFGREFPSTSVVRAAKRNLQACTDDGYGYPMYKGRRI